MKSTLAYATYFGVVGPLFGCMVLLAVVMPFLHGLGHHDEWYGYVQALLSILAMSLLMVPAAFVIGVIPGAITGINYGWLCSHVPGPASPVHEGGIHGTHRRRRLHAVRPVPGCRRIRHVVAGSPATLPDSGHVRGLPLHIAD